MYSYWIRDEKAYGRLFPCVFASGSGYVYLCVCVANRYGLIARQLLPVSNGISIAVQTMVSSMAVANACDLLTAAASGTRVVEHWSVNDDDIVLKQV